MEKYKDWQIDYIPHNKSGKNYRATSAEGKVLFGPNRAALRRAIDIIQGTPTVKLHAVSLK